VRRDGGRATGVTVAIVRTRAQRMLAKLELEATELSVTLVDDDAIHELNATYRGKDKPTDVLAFAMREGQATPGEPGAGEVLGDVVISLDTATRQATTHRRDALAEVTMLLAHGLLHLVGYDHETDDEEREMKAMTRVLVRAATTEKLRNSRVKPAASRASHRKK
jgi:probable rRNA maturation factor